MTEKAHLLSILRIPGRPEFWFGITFALIFVAPGCLQLDASRRAQPAEIGASPATAAAGPLRVGTSGDYRPFSIWPEARPAPAGFSVDVARAFANDQGRSVEWVRFRWPALLADLASDQFDLALSGVTVRRDRSTAARTSIPLTTSQALVLVRAKGPLARAQPIDLNEPGRKLAVNAGGHLERVARRLFPRAEILAIDRNEAVLDRLAQNSVDGVVTDSLEAPHWQARLPGLARIGPLTHDRKAALVAPQRQTLSTQFDAWLLRAEAEGTLAQLRSHHGLPETKTARPDLALLASLDERLALMRDVARVKATLELPVEDAAREQRVLKSAWASVVLESKRLGVNPPNRARVECLFRAQIEAAKWIQERAMNSENRELSRAARELTNDEIRALAREELSESLRPALIRIGDRIAFLIAASNSPQTANESGASGRITRDAIRDALSRHDLPSAHLRALHEALIRLRAPSASRDASPSQPRRAARDKSPSA